MNKTPRRERTKIKNKNRTFKCSVCGKNECIKGMDVCVDCHLGLIKEKETAIAREEAENV